MGRSYVRVVGQLPPRPQLVPHFGCGAIHLSPAIKNIPVQCKLRWPTVETFEEQLHLVTMSHAAVQYGKSYFKYLLEFLLFCSLGILLRQCCNAVTLSIGFIKLVALCCAEACTQVEPQKLPCPFPVPQTLVVHMQRFPVGFVHTPSDDSPWGKCGLCFLAQVCGVVSAAAAHAAGGQPPIERHPGAAARPGPPLDRCRSALTQQVNFSGRNPQTLGLSIVCGYGLRVK